MGPPGQGGGRACPVPGCTAPAAPEETPRRAAAPAPAQPGWRTSHSPAPASPRPADTGSDPAGSDTPRPPRQPCQRHGAAASSRPGGRRRQSPEPCGCPGLLVVGPSVVGVGRGAMAARTYLQDGPIDAQQHLPGLVPHAEDVLGQRTLEQQVAEPPTAGIGWSLQGWNGAGATGAAGWGTYWGSDWGTRGTTGVPGRR